MYRAVRGVERNHEKRPGGRSSPAMRVAFALRSSVASPVRPASPPGFRGAPVSPGRKGQITGPPATCKGVPGGESAKPGILLSVVDRDVARQRRNARQPCTDRRIAVQLEAAL